ncbi:MAG: tetratricopeptide repeat protein [Bacteroidales bacterium]
MKQKLYLITLLMAMFSVPVSGQDFEKLENAFASSYEYETAGDYNKAVESLKSIYSGESYEINLRLGWLNYLIGNFTESAAFYQKAIELKPYSVEAKFGYVYPASAQGNWGIVKSQYFKILEIDPMNTTANYRLGMILYSAADYHSALKHFEKVVNQYPFDYDSTIMYAWTNYQLGKLREAEVLFKKTLLIKPGDESATEGLSLVK